VLLNSSHISGPRHCPTDSPMKLSIVDVVLAVLAAVANAGSFDDKSTIARGDTGQQLVTPFFPIRAQCGGCDNGVGCPQECPVCHSPSPYVGKICMSKPSPPSPPPGPPKPPSKCENSRYDPVCNKEQTCPPGCHLGPALCSVVPKLHECIQDVHTDQQLVAPLSSPSGTKQGAWLPATTTPSAGCDDLDGTWTDFWSHDTIKITQNSCSDITSDGSDEFGHGNFDGRPDHQHEIEFSFPGGAAGTQVRNGVVGGCGPQCSRPCPCKAGAIIKWYEAGFPDSVGNWTKQ